MSNKKNTDQLVVNIALPASEFIRMYQGEVKDVWARSLDGRSVRFPAALLRSFVQEEGVYGQFVIEFDQNHKLDRIYRLN